MKAAARVEVGIEVRPELSTEPLAEHYLRRALAYRFVRRAIEHPEFRQRLIENPQEALAAHGFALEQSDLREIENIRTRLREGDDVEQQLVTIAEHYGLHT